MNYYFLTAPQRDGITIATQQWCRKKLYQKSIRCITLQWFIDLDKEKARVSPNTLAFCL